MTLICHYFVIYKQPYTNQEYCFLFEQKILIFIDFREISIFVIILTFYIRIQGEMVPFQGPGKILNVNKMAISGWIALKLSLSSISIIKICKKNFFFSTNFFWPIRGSKSKKFAIFTKKPKNHEKSIFFFKNGHINPKIWKNEVPQ